jgi:hypothetical protein
MKPHRPARTASPSLPRFDREPEGDIPEPVSEAGEPFDGLSHSPDECMLDRFSTKLKDLRTGRKTDRHELWACGT